MSKFNGYFDSHAVEGFTREEKLTDGVMALSQNKERISERSMRTILPQCFIGFRFILEASKGNSQRDPFLALTVTNGRKDMKVFSKL